MSFLSRDVGLLCGVILAKCDNFNIRNQIKHKQGGKFVLCAVLCVWWVGFILRSGIKTTWGDFGGGLGGAADAVLKEKSGLYLYNPLCVYPFCCCFFV